MKDALYNLLLQKNVEFAEICEQAVLNACVKQHMASENGDCKPQS